VPTFPLTLRDPTETLEIALSKPPTKGAWFDLPGMTIKVDDVRWIGSEVVICGSRVALEERSALNPKMERRVLSDQ
jgi:hypothetical protein